MQRPIDEEAACYAKEAVRDTKRSLLTLVAGKASISAIRFDRSQRLQAASFIELSFGDNGKRHFDRSATCDRDEIGASH
jgi:hypothetical protein